jgi:hypothetical protein
MFSSFQGRIKLLSIFYFNFFSLAKPLVKPASDLDKGKVKDEFFARKQEAMLNRARARGYDDASIAALENLKKMNGDIKPTAAPLAVPASLSLAQPQVKGQAQGPVVSSQDAAAQAIHEVYKRLIIPLDFLYCVCSSMLM